MPALPANVRVVLAGRHPPSGAWVGRYGELLAAVPVNDLAPPTRRTSCAARASIPPSTASRGHPLALQLAATGRPECAAALPEDAATDAIVGELGRLYLDGLDEPTRRALAAASVTRRTTLSLLEAMLAEDSSWEAFDRVRRLPFVRLGSDGLVVHDTMHAVTARSCARPILPRTAATASRRGSTCAASCGRAPRSELWRCTADLLFLVDDPLAPSSTQAALILEVKRTCLAMRPDLRRT